MRIWVWAKPKKIRLAARWPQSGRSECAIGSMESRHEYQVGGLGIDSAELSGLRITAKNSNHLALGLNSVQCPLHCRIKTVRFYVGKKHVFPTSTPMGARLNA